METNSIKMRIISESRMLSQLLKSNIICCISLASRHIYIHLPPHLFSVFLLFVVDPDSIVWSKLVFGILKTLFLYKYFNFVLMLKSLFYESNILL